MTQCGQASEDIRISVSIMAHPSRAGGARALAEQLQILPVRVVLDPDPDAGPSTVRTARQAWKPWDERATHHLVLQDDVLLHSAFEEQVLTAVASQPAAVLSLFSEWGSFTSHAIRVAALAGYSWVVQPDIYLGTQAALMPVEDAAAFSEALSQTADDVPDDQAIHDFAHQRGLRHVVSVPNLVDHEVGQSLIGNSFQGTRRSTVFVPDAVAPASWWGREPLTSLVRIPSMQWSIPGCYTYERPAEDGAMWVIRPRLDLWGAAAGEIEGVVRATVPALVQPGACADARSAAQSVVEVLADQVALASALGTPRGSRTASSSQDVRRVTRIARRSVREAIRTSAPGCLRRIEAEHPGSFDFERGDEALLHLVQDVLPVYLDAVPQDQVRQMCVAAKA